MMNGVSFQTKTATNPYIEVMYSYIGNRGSIGWSCDGVSTIQHVLQKGVKLSAIHFDDRKMMCDLLKWMYH